MSSQISSDMAEVCVLCNLLSCIPGFYSSGCAPGSVSDAVCLPCLNGPSGPFDWISECKYECSSGFWLNGTTCSACSTVQCFPGNYESVCNATSDAKCAECRSPPVIGPTNWTSVCEYVCADGYFFRSEFECAECSSAVCFPGYLKTPCTQIQDSECFPCSEPAGLFAWADDCAYTCVSGYYKADGCIACSFPECAPGSYLSTCSGSVDSTCKHCIAPAGGGFVWTHECEYACEAGQYWFDGSECQRCNSSRSCDPGWRLVACSQASDSVCAPCEQLDGSFQWTSGCDFVCSDGSYADSGQCLKCSVPVCGPGTFAVNCTHLSDSICTGCQAPVGNFIWKDDCGFVCADGFYIQGGMCMPCTSFVLCPSGFLPAACNATHDVVCEPCPPLPTGSYYSSVGCEFSCMDGYFLNGASCHPCNTAPCAAGTYMARCTIYSDSECIQCAAPNGEYHWTTECAFRCADGYFLDGTTTCDRCSEPTCWPGTYHTNCSGLSDAACMGCPNAPVTGHAWTVGCEFRCVEGYYKDQSGCARCTARSCATGQLPLPCSATSDTRCAQCRPSMAEGFEWTDSTACGFKCISGYYLLNSTFCSLCSEPVCSPGYFSVLCTSSTDTQCAPCAGAGEGAIWSAGCQFGCADGYVLSLDRCIRQIKQRVFAVVHTEMAMQNTVNEICTDLASLMLAMSQALSSLSNGTVLFHTNITMLDGQLCISNICPQCVDPASLNSTTVNTTARRLVSVSVSISVVSQSTVPVASNATVLASPSASSLKDALVQSLASTSSPSSLSVGTVSAVVSTAPVIAIAVSVHQESSSPSYVIPLASALSFVSFICLIVLAVFVKRCYDKQQQEYEVELNVVYPAQSSLFSLHRGSIVLLKERAGRVDAITFRRRSGSRERTLSIGLL